MNEDQLIATKVISTEIDGLVSLKATINHEFCELLDIITNSKGRVIISGMGKSGHIAKKIAATFASTGTPSLFIHPGEASHGDLGMITKDDVVILLSNSGETFELKNIISYCQNFSIKLISIVRKEGSTLEKLSDLTIVLPNIQEANEVNAPTTSTTMMLCYGDAIAVALLNRKKFNKDNFGIFHPGGKLGTQFLKAKDIMYKESQLPIVNSNTSMSEVIVEMSNKRLGCVVVQDENKHISGIITDGDLRRSMNSDILNKSAIDIMTKKPILVDENILVSEAIKIMNDKTITSLIISNDNKFFAGMLHLHDCIRLGIT